jgi:hypothetical protein
VLCRNYPDVQKLIRGEVAAVHRHGDNQHTAGVDNVKSSGGDGNQATYALRRLKRDNPETGCRLSRFGDAPCRAPRARVGGGLHDVV